MENLTAASLNDDVAFVNDVIAKGYAQKVPIESLIPKPGKVWYLPHYGVYLLGKYVVFDYSAMSQGVSLNDRLLQGPDLTNSLVGVLTRFREEPLPLWELWNPFSTKSSMTTFVSSGGRMEI